MSLATCRASYATVPLAAIGTPRPGIARSVPSTDSSLRARLAVVTLSDAVNSYIRTRPACSSTEMLARLCVTWVTSGSQERQTQLDIRGSARLVAERGLIEGHAVCFGHEQLVEIAFVDDAAEQRQARRPREVERHVEQRGVRGGPLIGCREIGGVAPGERLDAGLVDVFHLPIDGKHGLLDLLDVCSMPAIFLSITSPSRPTSHSFRRRKVGVLRGLADRLEIQARRDEVVKALRDVAVQRLERASARAH